MQRSFTHRQGGGEDRGGEGGEGEEEEEEKEEEEEEEILTAMQSSQ